MKKDPRPNNSFNYNYYNLKNNKKKKVIKKKSNVCKKGDNTCKKSIINNRMNEFMDTTLSLQKNTNWNNNLFRFGESTRIQNYENNENFNMTRFEYLDNRNPQKNIKNDLHRKGLMTRTKKSERKQKNDYKSKIESLKDKIKY